MDSSRIKTEKTRKKVKVELTDAEKLAYGEIAAQYEEQGMKLEAELEVTKKSLQNQIKGASENRKKYNKLIREGFELREVDCTFEYDYETLKVALVRDDTKEVLEARDMTKEESQMSLFEGELTEAQADPAQEPVTNFRREPEEEEKPKKRKKTDAVQEVATVN